MAYPWPASGVLGVAVAGQGSNEEAEHGEARREEEAVFVAPVKADGGEEAKG
jgi:hypothetical protein